MHRLVVIGLSLAIWMAPAFATDPVTFKCEDKSAAAVNKYGGARGKCLTKCEVTKQKEIIANGSSTRVCSNPPGVNDAKTLDCITKAETAYKLAVPKNCPAGLPSCGGYAGLDPATYATNQAVSQGAVIDGSTVPLVACDPLLIAGEVKAVGVLAKLSSGIAKCLSKCYARAQVKGEAINCTPDSTPWDNLETFTNACILANLDKANLGLAKYLPVLPTCGLWVLGGVPAVIDLVTGSIAGNYADPSNNPYCAP